MASRVELAHRIASLVGDQLRITAPGDGWPALGILEVAGRVVPVAVFGCPVGKSHRGRDLVERRFQNPGKDRPIVVPSSHVPLLLGVWEKDPLVSVGRPVLVAADPRIRVGLRTRHSIFPRLDSLRYASSHGWAEHYTKSDELLVAFHPELLGTFVDSRSSDVVPSLSEMMEIVQSSGFLDGGATSAAERVRRATMVVVRKAGFGRTIVEAYGGQCAACGLNFGLVEGAHILPASAPESSDITQNGLALCCNHHAAFDRHLMFIEPRSRQIALHRSLFEGADRNEGCRSFVEATRSALAEPDKSTDRPDPTWFEARYRFFEERNDWAGWSGPA